MTIFDRHDITMTGRLDGHIPLQARPVLCSGTMRISCFRLIYSGLGFSKLWAWWEIPCGGCGPNPAPSGRR
jgi:hypothetical protein